MTLDDLLGRALESIPKDVGNVERLMAAAKRSLEDAQLPGMSSEGRFDMAYKSIMQAANAVLQANGFRTLTSKPGHHQTMIQTLPLTIGLERTRMITLDGLRKQRNLGDYSGDPLSESMAQDALDQARALMNDITVWMKSNQ
jgi:hypothetical protein